MLKLYHNSAGTQEITGANPDTAVGAVQAGSNFEDTKQIWVKGSTGRTYKNVTLRAIAVPSGVTVQYSTNGTSGWTNTLNLSDGDYQTAVGVYRRIQRANVQEPFKIPDTGIPAIEHELKFDEHIN